MKRIPIIDSHTGGEPTRVIVSGFPDLGSGSMAERRARFAAEHDAWRRTSVMEPRGNDVIVGALLCEPVDAAHAAGVIFFNNAGVIGMCGHGTIGLVHTLAHLGRIGPGEHGIETPVGTVRATLHADGTVSVRNVPAYRHAADVTVSLPGGQVVTGDIAWGGNWFFLVAEHGQAIRPDAISELTAFTTTLRAALHAQGHRGASGAEIDHIELFAPDADGAGDGPLPSGLTSVGGSGATRQVRGLTSHSRNFVLCPGREYDRSPCGTGTSAKLACLAARGELAPGEVWRQASVIGSVFEAWYEPGEAGQIIPTIRGRAHLSAEATLLIEDDDPFAWGIA